jgi:D-alanyl-D-alanine carboxypeptidase
MMKQEIAMHTHTSRRFHEWFVALVAAMVIAGGGWRHCDARPLDNTIAIRLQQTIDDLRLELNIPAISAAVITADNDTWSGASGYADIEQETAAETGTLFSISSLTKTFIAALTLRLVEDGVLTLEDTIGEWLPDLPFPASLHIDASITVRQLLNHTSGIANFTDRVLPWILAYLFPQRVWQQDDVLRCIGRPSFVPGTSFEYSNTNYYLMGMIIEAATGRKVSTVLRRTILDPLGLSMTFLDVEEPVPADIARGYRPRGDEQILEQLSVKRTAPYSLIWTAGAIVSTADDGVRFTHAVLGGTFLSEPSRDELLDAFPALNGDFGYGLGIVVVTHPEYGTMWLHDGALQGYSSRLLHLPDYGISVVVLLNTDISVNLELDRVTYALVQALVNGPSL